MQRRKPSYSRIHNVRFYNKAFYFLIFTSCLKRDARSVYLKYMSTPSLKKSDVNSGNENALCGDEAGHFHAQRNVNIIKRTRKEILHAADIIAERNFTGQRQ